MSGSPLGTRLLLLTRSCGASGEQAQARGCSDRADAGPDVELAEDVVDVPLDGADRELQVGGDLGIGACSGEESRCDVVRSSYRLGSVVAMAATLAVALPGGQRPGRMKPGQCGA